MLIQISRVPDNPTICTKCSGRVDIIGMGRCKYNPMTFFNTETGETEKLAAFCYDKNDGSCPDFKKKEETPKVPWLQKLLKRRKD